MHQIVKGLAVALLLLLPHIASGEGKISSASHNCNKVIENAELYSHLNNNPKALELLQDQLKLCKDSVMQSYLNYKIGIVYMRDGQFDRAIPYLNKFKKFKASHGDSVGIVEADIALGKYYYHQKDFSNATTTVFQALNEMPHDVDNELKANAFIVLAEVGLETKSFSEAKSYAKKALAISSNIHSEELKVRCFCVLSALYEKMGDYKSALYYKNKSVHIQDSLLKSQTLQLLSIQTSVNTKTKDVVEEPIEITEVSSLDLLTGVEDENKTVYIISLSLLFLFALIFFILFRSKVILSKTLKSKNEELERLNATKDKFFSIIAHDLKSPFNSLMGFSEVLSLQVESKSQREIMEYSRSIHNSTRKLYSLVETLLQWSRTQLGTTEYKPEKIDVKILAINIVSILKINAEEKDIVISVNVGNEMIAWADKDLFSAVLRNLVSNAIKFSRVGSVITVAGKTKGKNIEISVTDTGVGISKENLQKIFRVDTNISTAGTLNEKGTGLGLVLCKEFVEINKGTISAESRLEKGSTFKFTVPLSNIYS